MANKKKQQNKLLAAIEFLALAQRFKGTREMETHCKIVGGNASAFNGMIAAGIVIDEELYASPQTEILALALSRCLEQFSVIQVSHDRLAVRSGDFQAFIPCCDPSKLTAVIPDAALWPVDDSLTAALEKVAPLASDKAEYLLNACIQLRGRTAVATTGSILIQAAHLYEMPDMNIPKPAVTALIKCGKTPVSFGFSEKTLTIWFTDNSWIQTQLYLDKLPDVLNIFNDCKPRAIPEGLFEAIKIVAPFSSEGYVFAGSRKVASHEQENAGSKIVTIGADIAPRIYKAKELKFVADALTFDECANQKITYFFGPIYRAGVFHTALDAKPEVIVSLKPEPLARPKRVLKANGWCDCGFDECFGGSDCIPF